MGGIIIPSVVLVSTDVENAFSKVSNLLASCDARILDGESEADSFWVRWLELTFHGCNKLQAETVF